MQFQWTFLVGRQIGNDVGDAAPKMLPPVCLSTSFSIVSSMKDDRLKEQYALALVELAFRGLGTNVRSRSGYGPFIVFVLRWVILGQFGLGFIGWGWVRLRYVSWFGLCCVVLY